jgi:hypothetical protein
MAAEPARDARPFLTVPPPPAELGAAAWEALRALPRVAAKQQKSDKAPRPTMTSSGIAAAGTVLASALVLLTTLLMLWRSPVAAGVRRPSLLLRASFPLLGAGLALCLFSVSDALLGVLGATAYVWPFLVALGWVGLGAGRLVVDAVPMPKVRRTTQLVVMAGAVILVGERWLLDRFGPELSGSTALAAPTSLGVLLLTGACLGLPLAAGLRLIAQAAPALVPSCWGAHLGGWAAGSGLAMLLAPYQGLPRLASLGIVLYVLGGVLLSIRLRATGRAATTTT